MGVERKEAMDNSIPPEVDGVLNTIKLVFGSVAAFISGIALLIWNASRLVTKLDALHADVVKMHKTVEAADTRIRDVERRLATLEGTLRRG